MPVREMDATDPPQTMAVYSNPMKENYYIESLQAPVLSDAVAPNPLLSFPTRTLLLLPFTPGCVCLDTNV